MRISVLMYALLLCGSALADEYDADVSLLGFSRFGAFICAIAAVRAWYALHQTLRSKALHSAGYAGLCALLLLMPDVGGALALAWVTLMIVLVGVSRR